MNDPLISKIRVSKETKSKTVSGWRAAAFPERGANPLRHEQNHGLAGSRFANMHSGHSHDELGSMRNVGSRLVFVTGLAIDDS